MEVVQNPAADEAIEAEVVEDGEIVDGSTAIDADLDADRPGSEIRVFQDGRLYIKTVEDDTSRCAIVKPPRIGKIRKLEAILADLDDMRSAGEETEAVMVAQQKLRDVSERWENLYSPKGLSSSSESDSDAAPDDTDEPASTAESAKAPEEGDSVAAIISDARAFQKVLRHAATGQRSKSDDMLVSWWRELLGEDGLAALGITDPDDMPLWMLRSLDTPQQILNAWFSAPLVHSVRRKN